MLLAQLGVCRQSPKEGARELCAFMELGATCLRHCRDRADHLRELLRGDAEERQQLPSMSQAGKLGRIEARNGEVNELIECARYMGVWIDVHAEDLNDEKREHWIDNLTHRAVSLLGLIAIAL